MRRVGLVLIPLTLLIFNRSAGSDHDDVDQHAQVETELIRTARMAQLRGDSEHAFAKDSCPFVSYIATKPPHRKVVMTFDDGPSPDVTPWVMKVLAERRIPATFFLVGSRIELFKDMPGRIRRAGHLVGNHSWQHPNFHRIDQVTQIGSISSADGRLAPALWPFKLFRYPYGNSTCPSIRLLKQLDYNIVGWHADSCDWAFDRAGTVGDVDAKICDVAPENRSDFVGHVVKAVKARRGGILLMHEIHRHTIRHLPEILDALTAAGFTFTNLDDPELRSAYR